MADIVPFPIGPTQRHVVLVVDDEPAIRTVLSEFLRDCGLHPVAVESGDEAVRLLRLGVAIDIVFSDVRMPGNVDGYGLARWIMDNRPEIPLILVTGDLGKANAAIELCGAEVLAKPYDFDTAVKTIRKTLNRRHATTTGR